MSPKKKAHEWVHNFATETHQRLKQIHQMSESDIEALETYVENLGPENCWWVEYRIRDTILKEIKDRNSITKRHESAA